jgi:hypothetical protein
MSSAPLRQLPYPTVPQGREIRDLAFDLAITRAIGRKVRGDAPVVRAEIHCPGCGQIVIAESVDPDSYRILEGSCFCGLARGRAS